jgi:hypothetical protein
MYLCNYTYKTNLTLYLSHLKHNSTDVTIRFYSEYNLKQECYKGSQSYFWNIVSYFHVVFL